MAASRETRRRVALTLATVAVAALVGTFAWSAWHETFAYSQFGDRDLARAARWRQELPVSGSEVSGGAGGRVPGPLLGLLLAAAWALDPSPAGAYREQVVLASVGALALFALLTRTLGAWPSLLAVLLMMTGAAQVDTLGTMWNPGLLPCFVAPATGFAALMLARRDARWMPWWALCLTLGAQLHLSAALWGLATLPVLALARLDGMRAGALRALGVVATVSLPYVIGDGLRGFENTRRLMVQEDAPTRALHPELSLEALRIAIWPVDTGPQSLPDPVATGMAVSLLALAAAGLVTGAVRLVRGKGEATDRVAVGLTTSAVLASLAYAGPSVHYMTGRYALVLGPALAVAAAAGLQALADTLGRRRAWSGAALAVVSLLLASPRVVGLQAAKGGSYAWDNVSRTLIAATDLTGWPVHELARRSVWRRVGRDGAGGGPNAWPTVDHVLARQGRVEQGAGAPPCLLFVSGAGATPGTVTDPAWLRGVLHLQELPTLAGPPTDLGAGWTMVPWRPSQGLCPSTMTQRYTDTPAEADLRRWWGRLDCGELVADELSEGRRYVVALSPTGQPGPAEACRPFLLGLDVVREGGELVLTLHSNQLRGMADNTGWYGSAAIERPVVTLVPSGGAPQQVQLAPGRVGRRWVPTPLTARVKMPARPLQSVSLAMTVLDLGGEDELIGTRDLVLPLDGSP